MQEPNKPPRKLPPELNEAREMILSAFHHSSAAASLRKPKPGMPMDVFLRLFSEHVEFLRLAMQTKRTLIQFDRKHDRRRR